MKRVLALLVALLLAPAFAVPSVFDYTNNDVDVTATATTLTVGSSTRPAQLIRVISPLAASSVYVRFIRTGEPIVDLTQADITAADTGANIGVYRMDGGESVTRSVSVIGPAGYIAVSLICATGDTADNLRVWATVR